MVSRKVLAILSVVSIIFLVYLWDALSPVSRAIFAGMSIGFFIFYHEASYRDMWNSVMTAIVCDEENKDVEVTRSPK